MGYLPGEGTADRLVDIAALDDLGLALFVSATSGGKVDQLPLLVSVARVALPSLDNAVGPEVAVPNVEAKAWGSVSPMRALTVADEFDAPVVNVPLLLWDIQALPDLDLNTVVGV